ncbi:hypothetical protein B0H11DRAFT_2049325 [Mycena galericulata]|nr:hypothetical protein B0H11DRAFT_2049325 [Mycena galericulata]
MRMRKASYAARQNEPVGRMERRKSTRKGAAGPHAAYARACERRAAQRGKTSRWGPYGAQKADEGPGRCRTPRSVRAWGRRAAQRGKTSRWGPYGAQKADEGPGRCRTPRSVRAWGRRATQPAERELRAQRTGRGSKRQARAAGQHTGAAPNERAAVGGRVAVAGSSVQVSGLAPRGRREHWPLGATKMLPMSPREKRRRRHSGAQEQRLHVVDVFTCHPGR